MEQRMHDRFPVFGGSFGATCTARIVHRGIKSKQYGVWRFDQRL
jgi:hypothetical protein